MFVLISVFCDSFECSILILLFNINGQTNLDFGCQMWIS
jgi:hypothetical protein